MKLKDLFEGQNVSADADVKGLTADSRKVEDGFVFAALKGVARDGREFIPMALEKGAAAILCDGPAETGNAALVTAEEPRQALAYASAKFYPRQPENIVAVTGTNGKSSTVDFLRQIWAHAGHKAASMGTLGAVGPNGHIDLGHTTPDPVMIHETLDTLAGEGVTHAAMEASSHGLVQYRLDGVKLAAVAFTNLTQDHLDYHADFNDYRSAKLRLFSELAPDGALAVVNADSPETPVFEEAAREAGLNLFSVGWRGADLKIRELSPRATGQVMDVLYQGNAYDVHLPLIGEFQALNALTAAGLAIGLGLAPEAVFEAMATLTTVKGRLELVGEKSGGGAVFVDYAHTPDGLDVLLRAARPHTAGRLILVFGCGGDRDPYKRPMMGEIAAKHADVVIVTDDNPRTEDAASIRSSIMTACPEATEIADRAAAIQSGIAQLKAGDTLLIAGKGHEAGQIVGAEVLPFSDQDTAAQALESAA
ncbi:UDP-N-acetylmuramoyl-L-alanyl-D-glutamate--2,6-diaminopimelate ligase [Ponticaulis sp.]|uniref:UDP-N-acetylmuramoyl-L-alanyl-D-glutamate--2, 6-diaminopimelate ligase n=1 Tax=Ponticaulis sp. TaxID=2020902 RepID=UPI000B64B0FE|nr:UDP-N-acetylmuramoyl-L-alanyl-D-glutamate--2,6-diaminopimelate ligase [Ponticaulis sp.]MAJ09022.1 UDP-N-acetylmuramoyl-L-alanyl-D-glutamate--2,6-diaminopimelate ligase [Ponticaulis sp.]RPG16814.1 MAG: UDP-N-acetylmuramoyl-L-alanyl-D-glutamate--2,6-diaminopimelate ligase [Hyphomonadaceae bacterium TMED125]HBH89867.1 UDP-N-acetylmuramoyl-L-alanyl-D-glutamate--2,6-diaminopimelate ligase [Hyphomonadaceae bacterium]